MSISWDKTATWRGDAARGYVLIGADGMPYADVLLSTIMRPGMWWAWAHRVNHDTYYPTAEDAKAAIMEALGWYHKCRFCEGVATTVILESGGEGIDTLLMDADLDPQDWEGKSLVEVADACEAPYSYLCDNCFNAFEYGQEIGEWYDMENLNENG